MMVKICGITNREDALAAVESGASAIGLNFYSASPRHISPEEAEAIIESLPVWCVGVFVDEPAERSAAIAARLGLYAVQLHGKSKAPAGLRIWRAVKVAAGFDTRSLDPAGADAYLLDTPSESLHGGTGRSFDWTLARGAAARVIIAGGLDAGNVAEAIAQARPWGVDACSRLESAPRRKDHRKLAAFIRAAREAAA